MSDIELAPGKRARQAYSFDDIAIVPSRRTRDPLEVSTSWQIDAYKFDLPMMAAPMDSVVSPETAIAIGNLGGLGVLNLEGLWTRYEDPRIPLGEIASMPDKHATKRMQEIYAAPIKPELIKERIKTIRDAGVTVAASLSPARTAELHKAVIDAGVDIFVIRGTTVSAEHVAAETEVLNLKKFIYELDVPVIVGGVATATGALHLMRAGAAGVLVGFGGGSAHTTRKVLGIEVPMASAVAEVAWFTGHCDGHSHDEYAPCVPTAPSEYPGWFFARSRPIFSKSAIVLGTVYPKSFINFVLTQRTVCARSFLTQ